MVSILPNTKLWHVLHEDWETTLELCQPWRHHLDDDA